MISLAINTKNPNPEYLDQLIETAMPAFDEIVVYLDSDTRGIKTTSAHVKFISDGKSRDIKDGFNFAVSKTSGKWICTMCDDDFFHTEALCNLCDRLRNDNYNFCHVVHFPVTTQGGQWGWIITPTIEQLKANNVLPHGCFFKKQAFDAVGGYRINPGADWNLWIRLMNAGYVFCGYNQSIYHFRTSNKDSAWNRQIKEYGYDGIKREVLSNV